MFVCMIQFKCENGRIILRLKYHQWNKTATSEKFAMIKSSEDFVEKWNEMQFPVPSSIDSPSLHVPQKTSPSLGSNSKPKRMLSPGPLTSASLQSSLCEQGGTPAPKKLKFIKEGVDENIELSKKGKSSYVVYTFITLILPYCKHMCMCLLNTSW